MCAHGTGIEMARVFDFGATAPLSTNLLLSEASDTRIAKLERRIEELERRAGITHNAPFYFTCDWDCRHCPYSSCPRYRLVAINVPPEATDNLSHLFSALDTLSDGAIGLSDG